MAAKESYLCIATSAKRGVLASCYARSAAHAERVIAATFLDEFGEEAQAVCIDTGAAPNLWIKGDAAYLRSVAAA